MGGVNASYLTTFKSDVKEPTDEDSIFKTHLEKTINDY